MTRLSKTSSSTRCPGSRISMRSTQSAFGPARTNGRNHLLQNESNAFAMNRATWEWTGGYNEGFSRPGGGLCNLEIFSPVGEPRQGAERSAVWRDHLPPGSQWSRDVSRRLLRRESPRAHQGDGPELPSALISIPGRFGRALRPYAGGGKVSRCGRSTWVRLDCVHRLAWSFWACTEAALHC